MKKLICIIGLGLVAILASPEASEAARSSQGRAGIRVETTPVHTVTWRTSGRNRTDRSFMRYLQHAGMIQVRSDRIRRLN